MLKGKLIIAEEDDFFLEEIGTAEKYLIYDKDLIKLKGTHGVEVGDVFKFKLVDEFTHPSLFEHKDWGHGVTCAKIIFKDEE